MIDKNKTYRTRDGREVRIYAVDGGMCGTGVHGAIRFDCGWLSQSWHSDGKHSPSRNDDDDLIEVKPRIKREVWVNVYDDWTGVYPNKKVADETYTRNRIACVKLTIDCEEGEGL